jgi:glyoxylase-like metal-dependent hydrolase (beta-lactamase superfamily II)
MHIEPFFDARTSTLTYVVFDETTRDAVVIDPVLDYDPASGRLWTESVERVAAFIASTSLRLHLVLETHVHADHLSGSQWLKTRYGGKVGVSHRITEVQDTFKGVFGWPDFVADGSQFDMLIHPHQVVPAGTLAITALPTPGHTPACMSFLIGDAVFTGDALFLPDLGVGRCDFPKGSAEDLWTSVTNELYRLPETTRVFVGHDYPPSTRTWQASTTIGVERASNLQLTAVTPRDTFVAARTARDRTLAVPRLLYPSLQVNMAAGQLPRATRGGVPALCTPIKGP